MYIDSSIIPLVVCMFPHYRKQEKKKKKKAEKEKREHIVDATSNLVFLLAKRGK